MVITGEELRDFYAQLGEALFATQVVEGTLQKLLAIRIEFTAQRPTQVQADEVLARYRKETLGGLLRIAERNEILPAPLLAELREVNAERRFVVHRLQDDAERHLRNNRALRVDLVQRLDRIATRAFAGNSRVVDFITDTTAMTPQQRAAFYRSLSAELTQQGF